MFLKIKVYSLIFLCYDIRGDVKMLIGSHVHFGSEQILGSTKEAISYGANTFMFYTGAPQNTIRSSIKEEYISKAIDLMSENGIDIAQFNRCKEIIFKIKMTETEYKALVKEKSKLNSKANLKAK